jgi:hypothetical protein
VAGSLGAASAVTNVQNTVKAYIDASKVTSNANIELSATESSYVTAVSIGAAVAGSGGAGGGFSGSAAGAGSANTVRNTVSAYINNSTGANKGVSSTGGAIKLSATDATHISAIGGALAGAGAGGAGGGAAVAIGVSAASNDVANTISAYVSNSTVSAAGNNIELSATSTSDIEALAIGGTLAGAGGAGGGVAVAAAGAGTGNTIANQVLAYVSVNSSLTTLASGAVKLTATDNSSIRAIAGALALSGAGGAGGGGAVSLGLRSPSTASATRSRPTSIAPP